MRLRVAYYVFLSYGYSTVTLKTLTFFTFLKFSSLLEVIINHIQDIGVSIPIQRMKHLSKNDAQICFWFLFLFIVDVFC